MDKGEHRSPEYLAIHPHGRVPALIDGDIAIHESAAICMYIADKDPQRGLAPPVGTPARALYYQWITYSVVTAGEPFSKIMLHTLLLPPEKRSASTAERAREKWKDIACVLTSALAGTTFLVGGRFTAADVMVGGVLTGARAVGLLVGYPELESYVDRLIARPAFVKAFG